MATLSDPSGSEAVATLAFFDELEKIGQAQRKKSGKLGKWLRTSAAIAAGTGAGTATLMLGERALSSLFAKKWKTLSPQTRMAILGAGSSAATLGATVLAKRMLDRKRREEA